MESVLRGICLLLCIARVHGQCAISNCKPTGSFFTSCNEFTKTMDCMTGQFDKCNGPAGRAEIMLSMNTMHQPTDCAMSMAGMANSMTARSKMYASMMKKSPPGALTMPLGNPFMPMGTGAGAGAVPGTGTPPTGLGQGMFPMGMMPPMMGGMMGGMMGEEMEMEMPEIGEGPFEMMEDMMESGMMPPGMMLPGMLAAMGGAAGAAGGEGGQGTAGMPVSPGMMGRGEKGGAARFVDYRNAADGTKVITASTIWITLVAILLSLL